MIQNGDGTTLNMLCVSANIGQSLQVIETSLSIGRNFEDSQFLEVIKSRDSRYAKFTSTIEKKLYDLSNNPIYKTGFPDLCRGPR